MKLYKIRLQSKKKLSDPRDSMITVTTKSDCVVFLLALTILLLSISGGWIFVVVILNAFYYLHITYERTIKIRVYKNCANFFSLKFWFHVRIIHIYCKLKLDFVQELNMLEGKIFVYAIFPVCLYFRFPPNKCPKGLNLTNMARNYWPKIALQISVK